MLPTLKYAPENDGEPGVKLSDVLHCGEFSLGNLCDKPTCISKLDPQLRR